MVNVKFMALRDEAGEVKVASGIVMNCPSVEDLREKLEEMGAVVVHAAEATEEEVGAARQAEEDVE